MSGIRGERTRSFFGWRGGKGSLICKDIGVYISGNKVLVMGG